MRDKWNRSRWCHEGFAGLSQAGWQPLATLPFLLLRAAHHPSGWWPEEMTHRSRQVFFPFQLIKAIFTTARETVPLEKDVKHQLRQEGIFPLLAAGHLPGISAGTGTASANQQMRQSHTGHQRFDWQIKSRSFYCFSKAVWCFPSESQPLQSAESFSCLRITRNHINKTPPKGLASFCLPSAETYPVLPIPLR